MSAHPFILLSICCVTACSLLAADDSPVDFVKQIKPILAERCVECHNSESLAGNLNLQNRALAMKERKEGAAIVPKEPEKSLLYLALLRPPADKKVMPALSHKIPEKDIATIRRWILEGAAWPDGDAGAIHPRQKKRGDV